MVPTISHPMRWGTITLQKRMRGSASRNSSTSDDNSLKSRSGFNRGNKVRYLDTSGPSMARRSTRPWERRHLLSTDWGVRFQLDVEDHFREAYPNHAKEDA